MNAERIEEIRKEVARSDGGLWTYETEHVEALLAEVERLRKQNAELLEWNRYYLEVTKERRKQVEELREQIEEIELQRKADGEFDDYYGGAE